MMRRESTEEAWSLFGASGGRAVPECLGDKDKQERAAKSYNDGNDPAE